MNGPIGLVLEDIFIGQSAELRRRIAAADLAAFAALTGDENPLHLDEGFAQTTPFRGRIAHGMLLAGYISAVLGTRLPGPGAVYVSQSLTFLRPARPGDEVTARVEVAAIDRTRARVTLATACRVAGSTVLEGEAVVRVGRRSPR